MVILLGISREDGHSYKRAHGSIVILLGMTKEDAHYRGHAKGRKVIP